ncbi:hypothetical protein YYG_05188, partial [Plasmodium vinckei petteri]
MANSKNAYYDIYTISSYFGENNQGKLIFSNKYGSIHNYCHYRNNSKNGKCNDYFEAASSVVIHLLKTLKDKHRLEDDKLAEYAILWLSYKLDKKPTKKMTDLNNFYTNYIQTNNYYNNKIKGDNSLTYMEIIDKKKDLMNININEISKSNGPFNILFYLNYVYHDEYWNCKVYSGLAQKFVDQFKEFNKNSKNIEGSSYNKLLSTLSDDYNNLKKKYHDNKKSCSFPSLPQLTPKKRPAENLAQIPVVNPRKGSGPNSLESSANGSEQILGKTIEVTSSSSSISTTLIPALSIVSVIP